MRTKGELLTPTGEAGGGGTTPAAVQTPPADGGQTQPERIIDDPLLSALADDLKDLIKIEKGQDPAPEIKPVEEPQATPAPAAAAIASDRRRAEGLQSHRPPLHPRP